MAPSRPTNTARPPLLDSILQDGKQAFDPELSEKLRADGHLKFMSLIGSTSTMALMPVLNLLIQPGRVQPWLRTPIISELARLPLRPRGVQNTIEFVLSVHPSNAGRATAPNTKGAGITHEALNAASRLISSPPTGMSPEDWFNGIGPQLLTLLDGEGEPGIDRAAAFIIGFGILGRKQFGAPGMPGWKALVDPISSVIDPSVTASQSPTAELGIIELGAPKILVRSQDLALGLKRLSTLLTSHPHPSLTKRILTPLLLPLWTISYWPYGNGRTESLYRAPARRLLKVLIQLLPAGKTIENQAPNVFVTILQSLTFQGRSISDESAWAYNTAQDGALQIVEVDNKASNGSFDIAGVDIAVNSFISLLEELPDLKSETASLFMSLCTKWLAQTSKPSSSSITTRSEPKEDRSDVKTRLIEAKVMQKMMTAFPNRLVDDSRQVIELVDQVLIDFVQSNNDDEDAVAVGLSLLNIVLTAPSLQKNPEMESRWNSIQMSLQSITRRTNLGISSTTNNLLMLLRFRSQLEEPEKEHTNTISDRELEDRKSYNLAMSYLTATDSPPPVRVEGLEMISKLIKSGSTVLDIPALLVLFSSLLQDSEEYIYLRAIQSFIHLSRKHPRAVMKDLIDRYVDPNEDNDLDQRLRLGEALLQVIQTNHLAFMGDSARSVSEGLLFIAGRRGRRPKTQHNQERANKLKRKQNDEAASAWGGEVPQLDDVLDAEASEDNDMISQIVSGWESKRGSEDIRIRASALSILGSGIEAHIAGLTSHILSAAVDLGIHILTLELETEKGILRRAAVLLVMSFVKALSDARHSGQKIPFGFVGGSVGDVKRVLQYVESTDNDGLVRQHARDVVESLTAWEMEVLLPQVNGGGRGESESGRGELRELAGLSISSSQLEGLRDPAGGVTGRPRIEELE